MIILNDIGKIGIDTLITMIGSRNISKEDVSGFKEEYCSKINCSAYNHIVNKSKSVDEENRIKENMCADCPYAEAKIKIAEENEKHKYNIRKLLLFSRSLILQFLLYIMTCDGSGYVKLLSIAEMSEYLGVSERTIRNNNKYLINNGFICTSKIDTDRYRLFIPNYKDYFKSKKEYGKGYLEVTKEIFEELIKDEKVVSIRAALRLLLEENKVNRNNPARELIFTYKNIQNFLPSYVNCKKKVKEILKNGSSNIIFKIELQERTINYNLRDNYNKNYILEKHSYNYEVSIRHHITKLSRQIFGQGISAYEITNINDFIPDFVQMSHQHSLELVLDGIRSLLEEINNQNYDIKNHGGYVRNKIKDIINKAV